MQKSNKKTSPTLNQYSVFQQAIDFMNRELFDSKLPPCLLTLQRKKGCMGYFSTKRYISTDGSGNEIDEIAINPSLVGSHGIIEVLQTLVHEQCHQWQYSYGNPSHRAYHNREWADKMESVGLIPSHTGKPGGKKTGQKMADYPAENGLFIEVARQLINDKFNIPWSDRYVPTGEKISLLHIEGEQILQKEIKETINNKKKVCYVHVCDVLKDEIKLWGKPSIKICCGECGVMFTEQS